MNSQPDPMAARTDPTLDPVTGERRQLTNLAYRLLGSLADAEDVVQETYARWYTLTSAQQAAVRSPGGWLMTVASRICLDLLGSARARRERYVGEWLPEPLPGGAEWSSVRSSGTRADPADRVTLDESVSMAFLVVLDSLRPAERVALILHDVFGYSFGEIAEIVGRTPVACRQLAASGRRRLRARRAAPSAPAQSELVRQFKQAWDARDVDALIGLLDPSVTAIADGGGLASAYLRPVEGREDVARVLIEVAERLPEVTTLVRTVNGQPGLVTQVDGVTVAVMAFEFAGDLIGRIWSVRNPEKLRSWAKT